ncbi:MAG: PAS domain S-box protein [Ignavibacteriales bacterium]|nr:PAS domain S-box protein [Ignavibacteriales bacterium]
MSQEKILICVQENSAVKNLESKLINSGFSVVVSKTEIKSVVSLALESYPDFIVISVNLNTKFSGIEAVSEIKQQLDIPVIYLSHDDDKESYNKAKSTNPTAYFSFPFEIDNLIRSIELGLANYKLQQKISDARKKYEMVIKASKAGVYEIDPITFEIDCEESLAEVFSYSIQEVKDKGWGNLLPIEDYNKKKELLSNLLQDKIKSYSLEHRVIKKDGSLAWALSHGSLVTDTHGKSKIVGTLTDITERKINEERLKKYSEDLQKSNSAKDRFFSIISHDLRNPFNSLLGFSELLANNIEDLTEQEVKDSAKTLHRTATNLFNLLTNLLEWSRLQTGNFSFEKSEFSICIIVNHVLSIFSDSFEAKNLKLTKETDLEINVLADQNMIEASIRNLVSNAIKFTHDGGTITVGCKTNGDKAEVFVKDTGVGLSSEDQERLFKIEKQFTTEGTKNEKGTGFGLLLTNELIKKNDGTIKVTSKKESGSTFTIVLPCVK